MKTEESNVDTNNNVMRSAYRELSDVEKLTLAEVKKIGEKLHTLFESLGNSREVSIAKTKLEEAVMWAVKHITK